MTAIVQVYTRDFRQLDEFRTVELGERNWLLNGIGQAQFRLGLDDAKATSTNLRIGNMVKIISDIGPTWSGRMDEIEWSDPDSIGVVCNSREALLQGIAYEGSINNTADIRGILRRFTQDPTVQLNGITLGQLMVKDLPEQQSVSVNGDFMEALQEVAELLSAEFYVDHETGELNFLERVGRDRSDSVFVEEGSDIVASPAFKVNANELIWFCRAVGKSQVLGAPPRGEYWDWEIRQFVSGDVRQRVLHYPELTSLKRLADIAQKEVEKSLQGVFTLDVSINNERGLFNKFFLGDTIGIRVASFAWGIVERMRVKGMGITSEDSPEMRLILEPEYPRNFLRYFNQES